MMDLADRAFVTGLTEPLVRAGLSDGQIGLKIGVSASTVRNYRRHLGLTAPCKKGSAGHKALVRASRRRYRRENGYDVAARRCHLDRLAMIDLGWPAGVTHKIARHLAVFEERGALTKYEWAKLTGLTFRRLNPFVAEGWLVKTEFRCRVAVYDLSSAVKLSRARVMTWGD